MTINEAKEILLEFYKEYNLATEDPHIPFEWPEEIIKVYAHKIIDKGQWS